MESVFYVDFKGKCDIIYVECNYENRVVRNIMDNKEILWKKFLSLIKKDVSSIGYETWFKDTKLLDLNDDAVILVPTSTHKNI